MPDEPTERQTAQRMTLEDEVIEQIARRVVELAGATHAFPARKYVDAADLARILGVDRDWVYANARRLGAIRLNGPGGRLRFELQKVDEVLAGGDSAKRRMRPARSRRGRTREAAIGVIDYER
jgi:hypothetical protein